MGDGSGKRHKNGAVHHIGNGVSLRGRDVIHIDGLNPQADAVILIFQSFGNRIQDSGVYHHAAVACLNGECGNRLTVTDSRDEILRN